MTSDTPYFLESYIYQPAVTKIFYEAFYIDGFKVGNGLKQGDGLARNPFNTVKLV